MLSFVKSVRGVLIGVGLSLSASVLAAPTLIARDGVTVVGQSVVSDLTIFAQFSRAAYCSVTDTWSCGDACDKIPGFQVYSYGGDGDDIPRYYVGYWPDRNTALVAHEGTDPTKFESLLTDGEAYFGGLDPTLFPGLSPDIQVHTGFSSAHAATANAVLASVQQVLSDHNTQQVTVVGHSLGAAIGTLEAAFLQLQLPSSTAIKLVGHGSPRVGNQQFVDYINSNLNDVTRINHAYDPIPIVPGRFLGYHHVNGEIHIDGISDEWDACAGEDNTDVRCSTGAVPNIFKSDIIDHLGPYNGIMIGTPYC